MGGMLFSNNLMAQVMLWRLCVGLSRRWFIWMTMLPQWAHAALRSTPWCAAKRWHCLQPPAWSVTAQLVHGLALVDAVNSTHLMLQVTMMAQAVMMVAMVGKVWV
jgi:hypothetical protein